MTLSRKLTAAALFCAIGLFSFAQTTEDRIRTYFQKEHEALGLSEGDYSNFEIKNEHSSSQFDISYAYAHQQYEGITIYNAIANFAFILPPLLYMTEFKGQLSIGKRILNWAIVIFGAAGSIYSVYYSI